MPPSVSVSAPPAASNTTSVQVAVRIRPPPPSDASSSIPSRFQRTVIHPTNSTTITVDNASTGAPGAAASAPAGSPSGAAKKTVFAFDQVLPPDTTQYELFTTTASPLISRFMEGFNTTILAYGQTSSGKTHSMTGVDLDADPNDPTNGMGIIPRAVSTIFSRAAELKRERGQAWQWSIKASFIELYNEDLIDLLGLDGSDSGARREVQIREDKDGHIIWEGLREIPVRSAADVMSILIRGTSLRRTNETDMNAQSSRSHAIFSLTMTQKKYVGSTTPSRSGRTSPMPPTPSPSKLVRPGSMYGAPSTRVGSPTLGRPPTPSFASAMARSSATALRSSSALGMRPSTPEVADEDKGEWVTVVSKFHFVDLAGSERLKRTAAAGDRIKEGISINGGLLALGNVISALGDPSRSRTLGHGAAVHVPYRDSKLTRLLQDSLGGNAHTLMIACVSPAEWNLAETVNTLKYANRARNIRNRAEIREKEDGWDDIEWLQTMVNKLRKELKSIKEGGNANAAGVSTPDADDDISTTAAGSTLSADRAGGRVLKQYTELQNSYHELRTEYVERNEELARLRKELEEKSAPPAAGGGGRKYEEIVGPVIEEYEKTIGAMEAELKLSRTALEHTNEMYAEQENELAVYKERNSNADGYIEALRARVTKLAEREASTESYVRDIEAKLKAHAESSTSSADSSAELRKEVLRYKETELSSTTYIAKLEQRLTQADTDIVTLRAQVDKLEQDLDAKNVAFASLQGRMDVFLREREDAESWRQHLDERERRVQELERKMEEWEKVRIETSHERERLNSVVSTVQSARRSLETEVAQKEVGDAPQSLEMSAPSSSTTSTMTVTPQTVATSLPDGSAAAADLMTLQATHSSTLTELESVSSKYRDALREISDLAAQIAEAKLHSDTSSEVDTGEMAREPPKTPTSSRRRAMSRREFSDYLPGVPSSPSGLSGTASPPVARRSFFRHAASSEGLHSRSQSQSQSQDYSSPPPFSRTSWALGAGDRDSLLSPGSLSAKLGVKLSPSQENIRTAESLEKEIMRLQEVLKDRESEISLLEKSLAAQSPQFFPTAPQQPEPHPILTELKEDADASPPETVVGSTELSPVTLNQFNALKQSLLVDTHQREAEQKEAESISRLDELMRSMAQKESQHVATVDKLNDQLQVLRRQHDDLTILSRDQATNLSTQAVHMSTEIESLRSELGTMESQHGGLISQLDQLRLREAELTAAHEAAQTEHVEALTSLRAEHAAELVRRETDSAAMLARHAAELDALKATHAEQEAAHAEALRHQSTDHESTLARVSSEYDATVSTLRSKHEADLADKANEASAAMEKAHADHQSVLSAMEAEREMSVQRQAADAEEALTRLSEDHAADLKRVEMSREGTLTESQSRQAAILRELQDEHRTTLERKEADFKGDLEKAKTEHLRLLAAGTDEHLTQLSKVVSQHEQTLEEAQAEHVRALSAREAEFTSTVEALRAEHDFKTKQLDTSKSEEIAHLTEALALSQQEHQASSSTFRTEMEASLAAANSKHDSAIQSRLTEHDQSLLQLKADHQASIAKVHASLIAAEECHRQALAGVREEHDERVARDRQNHTSQLAELEDMHNSERDILAKAHDLLKGEVASLKKALAEAQQVTTYSQASHQETLVAKDAAISTLEQELGSVKSEHASLAQAVQDLRDELDHTRHEQSALVQAASKRESLVAELEHHRSVLRDAQNDLQRTKDEADTLREEKNRQDQILREMQTQLQASTTSVSAPHPTERTLSHQSRSGTLPPAKLPPLTPPPSIPPPPVPTSVPPVPSLPTETTASTLSRTSTSNSQRSLGESESSGRSTPSTSILVTSPSTGGMDSKILQNQIMEQNHHIEEQETMIKTLNKQLTHCESDLQAHMDLVATLETSLTDSERNLRKTRMQANEYAKERDGLNGQIDSLRIQLQQTQQEIVSVRRSVVEEKQNYESKLDEERRAKERTRAQLDSRMEELQKRKSKFVCL